MKISTAIKGKAANLYQNALFKNSSWGIISQISQTAFLSMFFVIIAREYSTAIFAKYIIANAIYQLVTAFSTMGLSQWFIREFITAEDKEALIGKFLKVQVYFGAAFYLVNILLAYLIYDDQFTRYLIIIMGVNVVFDNLINAIKCLNVANFEQRKTFIILTVESVLKFLAACILFVYPISIINLSIVLIAIRFLTLNLFLSFGSSNSVNIKMLFKFKVSFADLKKLILSNWAFVIIGGISIINWRIANIIIAKMLSAVDVANYEISFKIFSIAQILPVVISTSVFPMLVKFYAKPDKAEFQAFYKKMHLYYMMFGLLSFTFIYAFADTLIPLLFGAKYQSNPEFTKQMFLTILLFPTALLQANVLITLKMERMDMLFNILALIVNVTLCLVGLHYSRSLTMVNYSICCSFLVFHLLQDVLLVKNKITTLKSATSFYIFTILFVIGFALLARTLNGFVTFAAVWAGVLMIVLFQNRASLPGWADNKVIRAVK